MEPVTLEALAARLRTLETWAADTDTATAAAAAGAGGGGLPSPTAAPSGSEAEVPPAYPRLEDWVEQWFTQTFTRAQSSEWQWCPTWWDHTEAVTRLESLWRSWETLRLDTRLGVATWLVQHLGPQLPTLTGPHGPFARCTLDNHQPDRPLPTTPHPSDPDQP